MRSSVAVVTVLAVVGAGCATGQAVAPADPLPGAAASASETDPLPEPRPIGTMSQLMVDVIYPTSDAIFYIDTRTPTTSEEWTVLEGQTLMLAEAANLLMMPERARGRQQWMRDAKLLLDVGEAAFEAARAKDVAALSALNDRLYESCVTCHRNFRPGYGRRGGAR